MKLNIIAGCMILGSLSAFAQEAPVTLDSYKEKVLDYSRQIKQSSEQRVAMQEAMRTAKTAFFPAIDFSGNYQYRINKYDLALGSTGIEMDHNTYNLGATVSQPIYMGGKIYNNYKAAQIQSEIAGKSEELTVDNIIYSADMNYWSAAARKGMYDIMCQFVDIVKELEKVLEMRFNDGQISKTDLLQVRSRLKEAELNKSNAYKEYQIALQNMNILMGKSPMDPVSLADSITQVISLPSVKDDAENILSNRPDYSISQLEIEYQKRMVNIAKSKYNPSLSIGFQGSWGTPMLNVKGSEQIWTPTLMATLKIPIFHWGARSKEVNSQRAILRSKEYALDQTRDRISQEVANAWTSLSENTKQITLAKEACQIAEENLELNTFSYNEGKLPILDVLSAQLSWIQSYSSLIQTWYQQKAALAQYNKAVSCNPSI